MTIDSKDTVRTDKYKLLGGVHPSVIAIWAALIAASNMLPAIPILGTASTLSISATLIPLSGIFFGPVGGAAAAAIGQFIGQILAPHIAWLGIATFTIGTVTAFVAGCISRKKWFVGIGIIILGYFLWFSTAIGREAWIFPLVFYTMGIVTTIISAFIFKHKNVFSGTTVWKAGGIFFAAFSGQVATAAWVNFVGILLYQFPAAMWKGLTVVAPLERVAFAIGSTVIGVPLLVALPKIGVFAGQESENREKSED